MGAPYNYSTEICKCYHIDILKNAHKATNRKDYLLQMLLWLRRQEQLHLFSQYLCWKFSNWTCPSTDTDIDEDGSADNIVTLETETEEQGMTSTLQVKAITAVLRNKVTTKPITVTHEVAKRPDHTRQHIDIVSQHYNIPGFKLALKKYLLQFSSNISDLPPSQFQYMATQYNLPVHWHSLSVWNRCTITLPVVGFDNALPERRTILACLSTPKDSIP